MTSLTGSTKATLKGTVDGPSLGKAMFGSALQLGTFAYVWGTQTSAKACLQDPFACAADLGAADPWGRQVLVTLLFSLVMWIVSILKRTPEGGSDPSIVDRLWSILPVLYAWHALYSVGGLDAMKTNQRVVIMAVLPTLWGARLTYNFWIKGGFSGGEDYRWEVVRGWMEVDKGVFWKWEIFNLVFICFTQLLLILAFTSPIFAALSAAPEHRDLKPLDVVATALFLMFWAGETVADMQMFEYQTEKYRRRNAGEPAGEYARGFIETGLWGYSRHPNYFCEVSLWWSYALFGVAASGHVLNWSLVGAVFLFILFVPPGASIDTTESQSSRKYPDFEEYQKHVSRFVPWFPTAYDRSSSKAGGRSRNGARKKTKATQMNGSGAAHEEDVAAQEQRRAKAKKAGQAFATSMALLTLAIACLAVSVALFGSREELFKVVRSNGKPATMSVKGSISS